MNYKRAVLYLALFFGFMRAVLLFYHNPNLIMNIDEESNYEVATNHYKGRGYTYFDEEKNAYLPTAFHASFTIFVYESVLLKNHIHKRYWVAFCNVISAVLLAFSIHYFYLICLWFLSSKLSYYATFSYCLFPSVIYYIGTLFWYEQIVLSILIIVIYLMLKSFKGVLSNIEIALLSCCIIIASLLRIQSITIFIPLLLFSIFYMLYQKQAKKSLMYGIILLLGIVAHFPSLAKNKSIYGHYILSTQMGYEILQGHNPFAKGSWMGDWLLPQSALYQYSHQKIPHIAELNQYEEGIARKQLAFNWIKENPFAEIKLLIRKLMLYFLPRNFEFLPFNQVPNPINFIFYLGFITYIINSFRTNTNAWTAERLFILMPIIGSLTLTLVFFMGARWRYYAEPFMIIFAWMAFQYFIPRVNLLKNKFDGFQK